MDELKYRLGQRIRSYRIWEGMSQEKLAMLANCHPTYVGQLERGEKNATIISVFKLSQALKIPLSLLFEKIDIPHESPVTSLNHTAIPLECYELLLSKTSKEQEKLFEILIEIEKYKGKII